MWLLIIIFASVLYIQEAAYASSEVFIYYANETHVNERMQRNYETLDTWLRSDANNMRAIKIADQLVRDRRVFPKQVLAERQQIENNLMIRANVAIALFTNARAARGEYEVRHPGENFFAIKKLSFPQNSNYVLQSMPLSDPAVFSAALRHTLIDFDPKHHSYTLVTKSHGNRHFAVVPRIAARSEMTSRDEILAATSMTAATVSRASLPVWLKSTGITTDQYFAIIADLGEKHGMNFNLIYLEACNVQEGLSGIINFPSNIRTLIAPKSNTGYQVVNYQEIFSDSATSIADALLRNLHQRFPEAVASREPPPIWRRIGKALLFSIPLFIISIALLIRLIS